MKGVRKVFRSKRRIEELETENETLKDEVTLLKIRYNNKNDVLRSISTTIQNFKRQNSYGEAGYRDLVRQINDLLINNIEKKLSDEIFPYFTSNS